MESLKNLPFPNGGPAPHALNHFAKHLSSCTWRYCEYGVRQERTSKTSIHSTSLPISKKNTCRQSLDKHLDRMRKKCWLEQVMKRFRFESFMRFMIQSPKYGTFTELFKRIHRKRIEQSRIPSSTCEFLWNSKRCGWGSHKWSFFLRFLPDVS